MRGVPFKQLPIDIRKAIKAFYESYDADVPEETLWKWTKLPLHRLVDEVWGDSEINQSHSSFEAYHRWWIRSPEPGVGWPPKWTRKNPDSIYPIILTGPPGGPYDPEKGAIEDGWHRFHWYVDHWGPQKMIPITWAVC